MKRATIINGITDDKYAYFENQIEAFKDEKREQIQLDYFTLRKMDIKYCTGCWSCWLKTPGECPLKDEMPQILKSFIHSDLTIFVSPIVMGFVSKYIKKVNDRIIPLVHPYIGIFENELHHLKRYERYPELGLMLLGDLETSGLEENSNEEMVQHDYGIISDIYRRMALNLKTKLSFSVVSKGNMEVLENEMYRI